MTIIDALADTRLFGHLAAFRDLRTWWRWLVFLKVVYGLELGPTEQEAFRRHTGRTRYLPPAGGWREVVCIVGRQSGKTRICSTIAAYEAICATPDADGTDLYALMLAQDQRAALRTLFSYAKAPFARVPVLQRSVVTQTTDTVRLD